MASHRSRFIVLIELWAPDSEKVQEADHAWCSGHEANEAVEGAHVTTVEGAPAEHPVHTLKGTA